MGSKYTLGQLVTLSQGFAVNAKSKHIMSDSGLPLLRITDLINNQEVQFLDPVLAPEKCKAKATDIIYTRTGQVGLVFRNRVGAVHNNCFKVIPNEELIDADFLYWFLSQDKIKKLANGIAAGSVQKDLNHSAFKSIQIDLPDLDIQRQSGPILNKIADKIELNQQTNQTLEQMAQTLFKSWFVDFEPVFDNLLAKFDFDLTKVPSDFPEALQKRAQKRLLVLNSEVGAVTKAKAEVNAKASLNDSSTSINKESTNDSAVNIHQHFPSEFEHDDELGWIPKGWENKTIDDICAINPESWTKKSAPSFVNYVDLANAKRGTVGETKEYCFSEAPSRARRILAPHDTIIGVVRPANRSYAYVNEEGLTGSTGFAVVRPNNGNYRSFVYFTLTNDDCIQEFTRIADGAAYPAIKPEDVAKATCIFSNNMILEQFETIAGEVMKKIAANEQQLKPLTQLRNTLLPKLISGDLQLPEADS